MANDIMRDPPFITDYTTWRATRQGEPDADTTVHIYVPDDQAEPVWLGYFDGEQWYDVSGLPLGDRVTWWAPMLDGPTEPKLGDVIGHYQRNAEALVAEAKRHGVVITIEQRPLKPLAQGHYETVVSVRAARQGDGGEVARCAHG